MVIHKLILYRENNQHKDKRKQKIRLLKLHLKEVNNQRRYSINFYFA